MNKKAYMRFIYGIGKYGKLLWRYMDETGGGIDYLVQTNEPACREINGTPVISLETMMKIDADKLIYIAMNDATAIRDIKKNILMLNNLKNKVRVYNCRNFINDNLLIENSMESLGTKQCVVCGNDVKGFLPGGVNEEIFMRHRIIGGGYRENCKCPCCGAIDRERWLYYVLNTYTNISRIRGGKVLHFAPEAAVESYIKQNGEVDYYSGDIVLGRAMHVIDITNIPYEDNMFDYVISNHILEHIEDEEKAVYEIKRVLKENGKWIFSFPICTDMKTYEDETFIMPEQRLRAYGQKDHVRLYGYDFAERFEEYGLEVEEYSPKDKLDETQIDKYGLIKDDVIMVATKK